MGVRKIFLIPRFDFYPGEPLFYINRIKNFLWSSRACAQAPRFPIDRNSFFQNNHKYIKSVFYSLSLYVGYFFCNSRNHIKIQFLYYLIIYWQHPRPLKKISYELIQAYPSIPDILRDKPYSAFANATRRWKPANPHGSGRRQARRANYKKSLKGI